MMEDISIANQLIEAARVDRDRARANSDRDYERQIAELNGKENGLRARLDELDRTKYEAALANGNAAAAGDDLLEINAGGKIVVAKRSTLTQLEGTRMDALFSGRWDKKLQRDSHGRIFLDVNPTCFRAIVDYLNEMAISSEDAPPHPPSVDDESKHILLHYLELFGLLGKVPTSTAETLDSNIINNEAHANQLHDWLEEDGSNGSLCLLYRGSQDGISSQAFHSNCDNKGCTLTIIETDNGFIFGGYSNTPWKSTGGGAAASKPFVFALSGGGITSPCKMKLKNPNETCAVYHGKSFGPVFGERSDLLVNGSEVIFNRGNSYEQLDMPSGEEPQTIKEIEVFQVADKPSESPTATNRKKQVERKLPQENKPVKRFSEDVNKAMNTKLEYILLAESKVLLLEKTFKDENNFITTFASADTKDVVVLNVSGVMMTTKRSTLLIAEESVLAQQFDDSKWTEKGCNAPRVKEWTPDDVASWLNKIDGIPGDVGSILKENAITGSELLFLNMEGLKMIGVKRAGTLCRLLGEIQALKQSMSNVVTLIEHSPYCFGKILDYLRLKQLHAEGLAKEPALPTVCDSQRGRFEKVVKYYFPGDSAKFMLG